MVKRFLNFISREIGGLHEAAYLLGAFAVVSQILALVRDRLLAYKFGATHALDIYYAAFRIPDFIFVAIASMVSISVLIPFLMEKIDSGEKEAKEFIDAIFSVFFYHRISRSHCLVSDAISYCMSFFRRSIKIFRPSFR
jgi:putative peptidoglycan lipid II flippase